MKIITIPCLSDNYAYLIICEETRQAAIVDPASVKPVLNEVERLEVELSSILISHNHSDHTGGVDELLNKYSKLSVYSFNKDNEEITIGDLRGNVLQTPGHTSDSVCYYFKGALFTGDTLFSAGCGRLFGGTASDMYLSLNKKIASLPDETKIYFGHEYTIKNLKFAKTVEPGNSEIDEKLKEIAGLRGRKEFSTPSTLGAEKKANPFLRCEAEEIKKTTIKNDPKNDLSPAEVFRVIRMMKDRF